MKDFRSCVQQACEKLQERDPQEVLQEQSNLSYQAAIRWKKIRLGQMAALGAIMSRRYRG